MNVRHAILILILGLCAGFICGWIVTRSRARRVPATALPDSSQNPKTFADCDQAADDSWKSVRLFGYMPFKTLYEIPWEFCSPDLGGQRVRVMASDFKKVF